MLKGAAAVVAGHLVDEAVSEGVRRTWLADYVEQLVRWAVGPHLTARFLHECGQKLV